LHELEELLLFNTSVADIALLKNLAQLTWLDLYNTRIAETTALARLA
jgi:Leucine-rich repeat (LRR) protein